MRISPSLGPTNVLQADLNLCSLGWDPGPLIDERHSEVGSTFELPLSWSKLFIILIEHLVWLSWFHLCLPAWLHELLSWNWLWLTFSSSKATIMPSYIRSAVEAEHQCLGAPAMNVLWRGLSGIIGCLSIEGDTQYV